MKKIFNVAGPCRPDEHYMLPPLERCSDLIHLIEHKQYFVIHAARQSGKTTLLWELIRQLNEEGNYHALYCSLETVSQISEAEKGIPAIIRAIKTRIKFHHALKSYPFANQIDYADFNVALMEAFTYYCESLDKPLVIFFDEVDCLSNGTLISFLRQLRDGYINQGSTPFIHSIALVGMRNIRDYKGKIRENSDTLDSASPFNIVKASKTLRDFTQEEITKLYAQHTQETGQAFSSQVVKLVDHFTRGQPWLVNAIACEIVEQILEFDVSREVLPAHVEQAVQTLIMRRDTHIDSLMKLLKEARVQKIIEPVLIGENKHYELLDDDYQYVLDLGLLRETDNRLVPANPIYAEVIIRFLSFHYQQSLGEISSLPTMPNHYLIDGKLDMKKLLSNFQQFWRENSEIWSERYQYKEAAPQLILQAFLQKIVNSGGHISRELAGGNGRLDLCVSYQEHRYPIELKLRYGEKTYQEGKEQLADYMDKLSCTEGWLIVFDRRKTVLWEEKIFWQKHQIAKKTIHIVGC
jgi:hypothetical protein